ncbi:dihydrofolate reductase family protein [Chitinophaga arvensicola]|uniref:Dihydrofolate reductase n=1 Tax=Chitinophaga arvensicola TaxID=29529 RepID=A0A1I0SBK7_9BACT|nr:dihydrofolate reductase family protein [Chitinophaga arvensicola]SEW54040.1 Dihydrofolate reductase [Chitinophaga arvensicola]
MKKLKVYIAVSLDGYIATRDGKIDWLTGFPNPENTDYGYADFLATIDTTLMGHHTYKDVLVLSETFPYPDKTNYVFTRDSIRTDTTFVKFISKDILEFVAQLKKENGRDIWLVGGGQLNGALASLIDEMTIHVIPVVLGDGLPLFGGIAMEKTFRLTGTKTYPNSVLELHYTV